MQSKTPKNLYFIRHGLSELNVSGHFAGHTETPLTEEGRQQAKAAGQKAKALHIDYIIASPLGRTLETAQIIAKEIGYPVKKIHVDPLFIERNCGDMEAKTYVRGFDFNTVANAENDDMLKARAFKALGLIDTIDAKNILIVSHGGIGRAMRFHAQPHTAFEVQLKNGEIYHWT